MTAYLTLRRCCSGAALFLATLTLSACSETSRMVHQQISDTPAYVKFGQTGSESSLAAKTPEQLIASGFAYHAAGNDALARLHFITALKRDPKLAWAYVGLGEIDYRGGDHPSAQANFQQATALDAKNLAAILGNARSLRQQGKLNAAAEQLNQALKLAPNDVNVLTELAINYDLQGQENLAAPLYREIAQQAPDQASSYNNIGVSELTQGRYAEAIVHFSKAFMLNDKDERITNNLAMAFALYGQEDQALKLFRKTIGEAAAWNNIGYLYMTQERFDDAERALRKALELNPKFYEKAQENLERLEQKRIQLKRP